MPLLTCPCEKNAPMQPVNRHGVEIDVCTQCKGVWLDRGELEKLLVLMRGSDDDAAPAPPPRQADRSSAPTAQHAANQAPPPYAPPPAYGQPQGYAKPPGYGERGEYGEKGEYGERGHYDPRTGHYRKKKGFEFFDFFD